MFPFLDQSRPQFAGCSRAILGALSVRAARRVAHRIADAEPQAGEEVWEWLNVTVAALNTAEARVCGQSVSRFSLELASEMTRAVATAGANLARRQGLFPAMETVELVVAATAFAVDLLRVELAERAGDLAFQSLRAALTVEPESLKLLEWEWKLAESLAGSETVRLDDSGPFGELWPMGKPADAIQAEEQLERRANRLPQFQLWLPA